MHDFNLNKPIFFTDVQLYKLPLIFIDITLTHFDNTIMSENAIQGNNESNSGYYTARI